MQRHLIFANAALACMAANTGTATVQHRPTGSRASSQNGVPDDKPKVDDAPKPDAQVATGQPTEPAPDVAGDGSQSALGNATAETERQEELSTVPGETKADKFTRLGKARMNRAILAVRSLSKLATSSYESTDEQRGKMFATLRKELDTAEQSFKPKGTAAKPAFDF